MLLDPKQKEERLQGYHIDDATTYVLMMTDSDKMATLNACGMRFRIELFRNMPVEERVKCLDMMNQQTRFLRQH